jgi:tryptophan synthase beta chain
MLNPVTHEAMKPEDMEPIFCKELIRQELDDSTPYFDIPEEVQAYYRTCRPSPLVRAY